MSDDPDAALYDLLQARFGLGSWDERSGEPWWKARNREVAKIRASRVKRNVRSEDLMLAADYCSAKGIHVGNVLDLYRHISSAIKWGRERALADRMSANRAVLEDAIAAEYENGGEWLDRLLRAQGSDNVEEVLEEWRQTRT